MRIYRTRRGIALLAACVVALLAAGYMLWSVRHDGGRLPRIAVMSSAPLAWGETDIGAIARGEAEPDPLVKRLAQMGRLTFVDTVSQIQAARPDIAVLIQPRALSPEELVRLDKWVRAGGRLLLFADPAFQWPSDLPLGDPQRPLFTSMLSPLFDHWGLELALPMDVEGKQVETKVGRYQLQTLSPGVWQILSSQKRAANCRIGFDGLIAECRPGKGQALLIADADLLQPALWQSAVPGVDANATIEWLEHVIAHLGDGVRIVPSAGD